MTKLAPCSSFAAHGRTRFDSLDWIADAARDAHCNTTLE